MTPAEALRLCRENDVKAVDLRFVDLHGIWHHTTIPVKKLVEEVFETGLGFDGSSIRGWQAINESDMLMIPQANTAFIDPFTELPTLNLICNIQDPITGEDYSRDPRNIVQKAANYLQASGIADKAFFGPEAEFFIFDDIRFDQNEREGYYQIDSVEGQWNRGSKTEKPNLGYKIPYQGGYFPVPPTDHYMDIRNEMMRTMIKCGLDVECQHHEVGTAGQGEIDLRYQSITEMADQMMIYKYIVRNVAFKNDRTATFMPKPILNDNGSGMHVHISLWKNDAPLFAGSDYGGLSEMGLHAIGGLLKHAPSLLAFTNPTTNSYKRLVPGFEAPVHLAYSQRNRSAACRIPMINNTPSAKRVEFRCPDPSCNPYLAFSAMLMAVIDGIQNKISPGDPLDCDIYALDDEVATTIARTPESLSAALDALAADHEYLLRDDVFTPDVIDTWIQTKRDHEVRPMQTRPHPHEFNLYYDC